MDRLPPELLQYIMQYLSASDLLSFCLALPAASGLRVTRLVFNLHSSLMSLDQLQQLLRLVAWQRHLRNLELLHRPDVTQWQLLRCLLNKPIPSLTILHLACLELEPVPARLPWLLDRAPNLCCLRLRLKCLSDWLGCQPKVRMPSLKHLQLHLASISLAPARLQSTTEHFGVDAPNLECLELHLVDNQRRSQQQHLPGLSSSPAHASLLLRLLLAEPLARVQFRLGGGLRYLAVTPAPPTDNCASLMRLAAERAGLPCSHRIACTEEDAFVPTALVLFRATDVNAGFDSAAPFRDPFTGAMVVNIDCVISSQRYVSSLSSAEILIVLPRIAQSVSTSALSLEQLRPPQQTDWFQRLRELNVGWRDFSDFSKCFLSLPQLRVLQLRSYIDYPDAPLDFEVLTPNVQRLTLDFASGSLQPRRCVGRLPSQLMSLRLSLLSLLDLRAGDWLALPPVSAAKESEAGTLRSLSVACRFVAASDLRLLADTANRLSNAGHGLTSLTLSATACDLSGTELRHWLLGSSMLPATLRLLSLDVPAAKAALRIPREVGNGGRVVTPDGAVRLRPHQPDDCSCWCSGVGSDSERQLRRRPAGHCLSAFCYSDICC